jgi:hypothetical protein
VSLPVPANALIQRTPVPARGAELTARRVLFASPRQSQQVCHELATRGGWVLIARHALEADRSGAKPVQLIGF